MGVPGAKPIEQAMEYLERVGYGSDHQAELVKSARAEYAALLAVKVAAQNLIDSGWSHSKSALASRVEIRQSLTACDEVGK